MKVTLIEAGGPRDDLSFTPWVDGQGRFAMPTTGLTSIASSCRERDEVTVIDEKVDQLPETLEADVVAISYKTMYARRAYELADALRARGTSVVLGGVHASLVPDEAAAHADVVVVGEGELTMTRVLDDLERGRAGARYLAPSPPPPLDRLQRQRVELLSHERYMVHAILSARGCSFDCEFCPTRSIFGAGYRLRDVDAVDAEVDHLLRLEDKPVFFSENVFGAGDVPFITELVGRLAARGVRFGVICDWLMLNASIVRILADGRCRMVCLNLTGRNEADEIAALRSVRDAKMPVWGYFMFGFEEDTPDVFERAVQRVHRYDLECATLTVLTPFPGTPMGNRLAAEGRIFGTDLDRFDHVHVHFQPAGMSAEQLSEGFEHVCREVGEKMSFSRVAAAMSAG